MFAAEFEPTEPNSRRRTPRAPVLFDASVGRGGMGRTLCKVVDLSIHGARLQTYSCLKRGTTIWLTLPDIGPVAADVMWSDDYLAGCQFQHALDRDAFETLADRT
jgi:PilZ domain